MSELEAYDHVVWHYTDAHGLLSILRTSPLWATSSRFLNDAGEVSLGWTLLWDDLSRRAESDDSFATLLHDARAKSKDGANFTPGEFFVLSAAQSWDLLAVWRNYGALGESYAIGLDANTPLAVLAGPTPGTDVFMEEANARIRHHDWSPVRYSAADQQDLVDLVFADIKDELAWLREKLELKALGGSSRAEISQGMSKLQIAMEQALLLSKHEGFSDEREIRYSAVVYGAHGSGFVEASPGGESTAELREIPGLIQYRATAYGIAPYLRLAACTGRGPLTSQTLPLPIRALAISPSPNAEQGARTLAGLLANYGYHDVRDPPVEHSLPGVTSGVRRGATWRAYRRAPSMNAGLSPSVPGLPTPKESRMPCSGVSMIWPIRAATLRRLTSVPLNGSCRVVVSKSTSSASVSQAGPMLV